MGSWLKLCVCLIASVAGFHLEEHAEEQHLSPGGSVLHGHDNVF